MTMPTDPAHTYTSPKGRPFRVSGLGRYANGWRVIIQFKDGNEEWAALIYGPGDRFLRVEPI